MAQSFLKKTPIIELTHQEIQQFIFGRSVEDFDETAEMILTGL